MKSETLTDALKRQIADLEAQVKRQKERASGASVLLEQSVIQRNRYMAERDAAIARAEAAEANAGKWQKIADFQYSPSTLTALYQAWELMPACNIMAMIGGTIQDYQAMQESSKAAEAWRKRAEEQEPSLYIAFSDCGQFIRYWSRDKEHLMATLAVNDFPFVEYYALPKPAPAISPKRFIDQLDADRMVNQFLADIGQPIYDKSRNCTIDYQNGNGSRIGILWVSNKPVALGAVFRDAANFSYAVCVDLLNGASHD